MSLETDTSMSPNDVSLLQSILKEEEKQSASLAVLATEAPLQTKSLADIATALTKIAAARPVTGIVVEPGIPTTH